jgi:hypothetical protein
MAEPTTPGHALIPQFIQPATVGLPTPISNRTVSYLFPLDFEVQLIPG